MPCFIALLALITPRIIIAGLYFFTNWFNGLFDSLLIPLLGFLFLPTTLLWYSAVERWYGGEWGLLQIGIGIVALLIDLSPAGGRRR